MTSGICDVASFKKTDGFLLFSTNCLSSGLVASIILIPLDLLNL